MVDFTKPVNNADMVKCLNVLIRCNKDLSTYYENDLLQRAQAPESIETLKNLHEKHAQLIGDTAWVLGGAPDVREGKLHWSGNHWLDKPRPGVGVLDELKKAEEKLQERYSESLQDQAVRASPECVAVINQVLDESHAALRAVVPEGEKA